MMLNSPEQYCTNSPQMTQNHSSFLRPFSDLHKDSKVTAGQRFGPVPNLFKWLHRQVSSLERLHESSQLYTTGSRCPDMEIALKSSEQNVEIIYDGDEYYFDALTSFDVAQEGVKAWLSKDIEAKLMFKPAKTWMNGVKSHYCLMCNLFSPHFNFIMLHMIFTCPKLADKMAPKHANDARTSDSNNNESTILHKSIANNKKRGGFDILSLLNSTTKSDDNENEDEESIDVETLEDSDSLLDVGTEETLTTPTNKRHQNPDCYLKSGTYKKLKSSSTAPTSQTPTTPLDSNNLVPNLASLYSQFGPTIFANTFASFLSNNSQFSPFIDSSPMMNFPVPPSKMISTPEMNPPTKLLSPPQNSCTSPSYSEASSLSITSSSLSPNIPPISKVREPRPKKVKQSEQSNKWQMPSPVASTSSEMSAPSTSGQVGSSTLPPFYGPSSNPPVLSSLYLLSPSLSALSFQASNVCAHCQTAFRMTSDLVYHMRSHHKTGKMFQNLDTGKKKRGEMLRCTICEETFRERHHLTRHMTSHQ